MERSTESMAKWVRQMPPRGQYFFTKKDIREHFPSMSPNYIGVSLNRLIHSKTIMSPWQNFYVIVPNEYALDQLIPPSFYVDQLMHFLECDYYVALLSASSVYGASHQAPMVFMVMVENLDIRDIDLDGVRILFSSKKKIPDKYIVKMQTKNGSIDFSSPELTAFDLIQYQRNVGGMNRASSVLNELIECVDFGKLGQDFFGFTAAPVVQRLGYIIEFCLDDKVQADILYDKAKDAGVKFRSVRLNPRKEAAGKEGETRWKIIVNQQIEIDE
jgi:hypothetical protein